MPLYSSNTQLPQQPKECQSDMPSPLPTSAPVIKRFEASILSTTSVKPSYTKNLTNTTLLAARKPCPLYSAGQPGEASGGMTRWWGGWSAGQLGLYQQHQVDTFGVEVMDNRLWSVRARFRWKWYPSWVTVFPLLDHDQYSVHSWTVGSLLIHLWIDSIVTCHKQGR